MRSWGVDVPLAVADGGYGDTAALESRPHARRDQGGWRRGRLAGSPPSW
ncbi:hypothetical protein [Streptomyces sp. SID12488]|nr:hypothetical protein [Streptomyces sp. SID12488]